MWILAALVWAALMAEQAPQVAGSNMMATSIVTQNNLGGLGPWTMPVDEPPIIEYTMLVDLLFPEVHLRVSNISEYTPGDNPGGGVHHNGLSGVFGMINVKTASSVRLRFDFYNVTSGEPFVVPEFIFTWLDLDGSSNGERMEWVAVPPVYEALYIFNPTELDISVKPNGDICFLGTQHGTVEDNPVQMDTLTDAQKMRTVSFMYQNTAYFEVELGVTGGETIFGRNFIFGGDIMLPPASSPPPPSPPPPSPSPPPEPFSLVFAESPGAAKILSDPHFSGLDGRIFDFEGHPGGAYALIVAPEDGLSILARFQRAYTSGVDVSSTGVRAYKPKGTWISSLVLLMAADSPNEEDRHDIILQVAADRNALPQDTVDDLTFGAMRLSASSPAAKDLMTVEIGNRAKVTDIKVSTVPFSGSVSVVPPPSSWEVEEDAKPGLSHLNLQVDRLTTKDAESLEGLLGITATGRQPGEGSEEVSYEAEYYVSSALIDYLV